MFLVEKMVHIPKWEFQDVTPGPDCCATAHEATVDLGRGRAERNSVLFQFGLEFIRILFISNLNLIQIL
jgi:hypothetical protein